MHQMEQIKQEIMKKTLLLLVLFLAALSAKPQVDTVVFVTPGGFYEDVFELEMYNYYAQNQIRYTTNGNIPDANSPLYTGSLTLDSSMYSRSDIYTIVNTIPSIFYLADDVQRAIVIRAAAFDADGNRLCEPVTNTYFIGSLGCDFHGLPVVEITVDSLSLFDYETGIFVPGIHYDSSDSTHTGNFKMRGREWERVINFEFYEPDNRGVNQYCGLRTHGGASRFFQQKGMKLYAREEYGKKKFSFPFFGESSLEKFKHICLHPFRCSNWLHTGGQEYLSNSIARNLDFESLAVRQVVVFINGEYWGIYTMEESPDERYLESHFDLDLEELAMIKYWGVPYYGDPTDWHLIYNWIKESDLGEPENWAYVSEHIDVSSFLDYMLYETFSANLDWPQNNVKIWQPRAGGRFRWLFYDGDGCFTSPEFNAIEHSLNEGGNSKVFIHFRQNKEFLKMFRERYFELRKTHLSYESMKQVLDEYGQLVEDEVPRQSQRFGFPETPERWYADMQVVDDFLLQRDWYFRAELIEYFNSTDDVVVPDSGALCYPNPTRDQFVIKGKGLQQVVVYDILGQQVCRLDADDEVMIIDLSDRPVGLYVVNIIDREGRQYVKKLVKN